MKKEKSSVSERRIQTIEDKPLQTNSMEIPPQKPVEPPSTTDANTKDTPKGE